MCPSLPYVATTTLGPPTHNAQYPFHYSILYKASSLTARAPPTLIHHEVTLDDLAILTHASIIYTRTSDLGNLETLPNCPQRRLYELS